MSDQFSINRVGTVPGQEFNYQAAQAQQNATLAANIKTVEQPDKKSEAKKDKPEEERKEEQKALRQIINNVEMDFDVDRETNEITLKILDKETKEIIRTIPERAWGDLSVAELFKITA